MKKRMWILGAVMLFVFSGCANRATDEATEDQALTGTEIYEDQETEESTDDLPAQSEDIQSDEQDDEGMDEDPESVDDGKSYASTRDFPYETIQTVDTEVYEALKCAYEQVDFSVEYKSANMETDSGYIDAYCRLIGSGMEKIDRNFDPHEYIYYVFDADGDTMPEICLWKYATYIFKYDAAKDEIYLWYEIDSPWEQIWGTDKLGWNWEGMRYSMCELDQNGDVVSGVCFMEEATWSNGKETFLVTMPFDRADDEKFILTEEMKKEAYYSAEDQLFYFPVTKEQYGELTEPFFEAEQLADQGRKKVGHTYDELVGNQLCETCAGLQALYL